MKAIETWYAGHKFRSRLEARWAVFFNCLSIEWKYEDQGYEFDGETYLPDFVLPASDQFVEVKGDPTKLVEAMPKLRKFTAASGRDVLILREIPNTTGYAPVHPLLTMIGGEVVPVASLMAQNQNGFATLKTMVPFPIEQAGDQYYMSGLRSADEISFAYNTARAARFEHGQRGVA